MAPRGPAAPVAHAHVDPDSPRAGEGARLQRRRQPWDDGPM